jgi:hypothetical protein
MNDLFILTVDLPSVEELSHDHLGAFRDFCDRVSVGFGALLWLRNHVLA